MGILSTLLVNLHLLTLEMVQFQLDLMRNSGCKTRSCDVGIASSVVLVRCPSVVDNRFLDRELEASLASWIYIVALVRVMVLNFEVVIVRKVGWICHGWLLLWPLTLLWISGDGHGMDGMGHWVFIILGTMHLSLSCHEALHCDTVDRDSSCRRW